MGESTGVTPYRITWHNTIWTTFQEIVNQWKESARDSSLKWCSTTLVITANRPVTGKECNTEDCLHYRGGCVGINTTRAQQILRNLLVWSGTITFGMHRYVGLQTFNQGYMDYVIRKLKPRTGVLETINKGVSPSCATHMTDWSHHGHTYTHHDHTTLGRSGSAWHSSYKYLNTSIRALLQANQNGVFPFCVPQCTVRTGKVPAHHRNTHYTIVGTSIFTWHTSCKYLTTSVWPHNAARDTGVSPFYNTTVLEGQPKNETTRTVLEASGSTWHTSNKYLTTRIWPPLHALWKGVTPS